MDFYCVFSILNWYRNIFNNSWYFWSNLQF